MILDLLQAVGDIYGVAAEDALEYCVPVDLYGLNLDYIFKSCKNL